MLNNLLTVFHKFDEVFPTTELSNKPRVNCELKLKVKTVLSS